MTTIDSRPVGIEPASYALTGVEQVVGMLSSDVVQVLVSYMALQGHNGRLTFEALQVPNSHVLYGDPLFDSLMVSLISDISDVVGCPVVPTYSYVRVYMRGQTLTPHRDRPACEHSVTIHLDASSSTDWDVQFDDRRGDHVSLALVPGDAAVYRGHDLRHWRRPCPVDWYMQAFLHFVDAEGPFASEALDGRKSLGTAAVRRNASR